MIAKKMFTSQIVKNIPKVPGVETLIEKLGMVPSPYLQYYYFEKEMLAREQADAAPGGPGTRGEQILRAQDDLFGAVQAARCMRKTQGTGNEGRCVLFHRGHHADEGAVRRRPGRHTRQLSQPGRHHGPAAQSVVETNCLVDQNGVQPLSFGALPLQVRALYSASRPTRR